MVILTRQYEVKFNRIRIGHTRLTHSRLMSKNNQQPTCRNDNNKTLPLRLPSMEEQQKEIQYRG